MRGRVVAAALAVLCACWVEAVFVLGVLGREEVACGRGKGAVGRLDSDGCSVGGELGDAPCAQGDESGGADGKHGGVFV